MYCSTACKSITAASFSSCQRSRALLSAWYRQVTRPAALAHTAQPVLKTCWMEQARVPNSAAWCDLQAANISLQQLIQSMDARMRSGRTAAPCVTGGCGAVGPPGTAASEAVPRPDPSTDADRCCYWQRCWQQALQLMTASPCAADCSPGSHSDSHVMTSLGRESAGQ